MQALKLKEEIAVRIIAQHEMRSCLTGNKNTYICILNAKALLGNWAPWSHGSEHIAQKDMQPCSHPVIIISASEKYGSKELGC